MPGLGATRDLGYCRIAARGAAADGAAIWLILYDEMPSFNDVAWRRSITAAEGAEYAAFGREVIGRRRHCHQVRAALFIFGERPRRRFHFKMTPPILSILKVDILAPLLGAMAPDAVDCRRCRLVCR